MTSRFRVRREAFSSRAWYRTLLRSYLYRPPVWVYLVELVVTVVLIGMIIYGPTDLPFVKIFPYFGGIK